MNRARGFAANHADQARMRVSQRVDGDAAEKIQIFLALRVVEAAAASARENDGRAPIGIDQMLRGVSAYLCGRSGSRGFFLFGHGALQPIIPFGHSTVRWAALASRTTGSTFVPGQRAPLAAESKARG